MGDLPDDRGFLPRVCEIVPPRQSGTQRYGLRMYLLTDAASCCHRKKVLTVPHHFVSPLLDTPRRYSASPSQT